MVEIETRMTGNLGAGLDKLEAKIKGDVLLSGVAAMARVIYEEVKLNTSGVRKGAPGSPPGVVTGNLHNSIYRVYAKGRSDEDTKVYHVSWNKSKAPHGHLLEFGTARSPAYPFMRPAFDRIHEAIKAGNSRMEEILRGGANEVIDT